MKKQITQSSKAHVVRGTLYLLLLVSAFVIRLALGEQNAADSVIDPTKSSLAVGQATSGFGEAQPTPVAAATAIVVWDQYNNAGTAVTLSATFTDAPAMNSDLVDDFVVQGYAWIVRRIDVDGAYFNGPGPANSFTVVFYADNDIQANMTAMCCGKWGWTDRTVTDLDPAVWRNPSGFFGACTSWSRRAETCGLDPSAPDQVYRIYANVLSTPTVTPTPTPRTTPTPRPRPMRLHPPPTPAR